MEAALEQSDRASEGPQPGFHNLPNEILSPMIRQSGLVFAIVRPVRFASIRGSILSNFPLALFCSSLYLLSVSPLWMRLTRRQLLVLFFLLRQYVFEAALNSGLIYKRTWPRLNARQKRGFVNHHLSFVAKLFVLLFAIYPFFAVATGHADFRTPLLGHRVGGWRRDDDFTMGDALYLAIMIVSVMYGHELAYREGISYVAVAHHVGVLVMGQLTLYWSASHHQRDSSLEVVLCLFWGRWHVRRLRTTVLTWRRILRPRRRGSSACYHDHLS